MYEYPPRAKHSPPAWESKCETVRRGKNGCRLLAWRVDRRPSRSGSLATRTRQPRSNSAFMPCCPRFGSLTPTWGRRLGSPTPPFQQPVVGQHICATVWIELASGKVRDGTTPFPSRDAALDSWAGLGCDPRDARLARGSTSTATLAGDGLRGFEVLTCPTLPVESLRGQLT